MERIGSCLIFLEETKLEEDERFTRLARVDWPFLLVVCLMRQTKWLAVKLFSELSEILHERMFLGSPKEFGQNESLALGKISQSNTRRFTNKPKSG